MPQRPGVGAIEEFDGARFGGPTQPRESQGTVGLSATDLVKNNPDRVMLTICNNGPDDVTWGLEAMAAAGTRQRLGNGQTLVFQVANDGALTGARLWFIAPVNPSAIDILEVIRVKRS